MKLSFILIAVLICIIMSLGTQVYLFVRGNADKKQKIKQIKEIIDAKHIVFVILEIAIAILVFYNTRTHDNTILHCYRNMLIFIMLVPMALIDAKEEIIPNKLIISMLGIWFILSGINIIAYDITIKHELIFALGGLAFGGGLFLICSVLVKGSVGMGDVKLFSVLGMIYGFNGLFTILFVTLLVLFVVCIVMLIGKKVNRKSTFPMAPFVLLGFVVSAFLGV